MKPNELRIGNYINDYYNQDIIVSIDILIRVQKCYDNRKQFQNIYSPIHLNEYWLKKAGAQLKTSGSSTKAMWFINNYEIPEWIKYVHELQNWYYWHFKKIELKILL